ncbi:hypothetical protein JHL22_04110 [Advenella sp. WQ 585]|uniref:2,5-dihydroxypyridine 5,6-dioxygenase n=1 Tax=Advenella mandrilli TaxID=2800330 RepID=A0ABS1EBJ0_9BURK|nr:hypothetical protein [Advenella mandrilli]MBK1780393.1 hypothetical protein [Advenella mandrilli]NLY34626.1 hypothetical protein [Alcaligenaceae bacterium]
MNLLLVDLFVQQYKLCKLTSTEKVAVISEYGEKTEYVEAAVVAARSLGAAALVLTASSLSNPLLPPYKSDGREVAALLSAAGECDLIIDVTVGGLIHSDVRTQIIGKGKRMLFVAEPTEVLGRLIGTEDLKNRVSASAAFLRNGSRMHVTSQAGTDLVLDISGESLPITCQWGYVDEPARWDHWPSGFIACFPQDKSAQGTIVLQAGDVFIPWQRYVSDDVIITVKDGYITNIDGNGHDARLLSDYFAQWHDPEVYALSHMGWGLHPLASWSALNVYDPRSLYGQELRSVAGNFMWSTGSNRFAQRETPAHLDIPMRDCTICIDETVVVRQGKLEEKIYG